MGNEIVQWQRSVLHDAGLGPPSTKPDGIASRLGTCACELFRLLVEHARDQAPKDVAGALEREFGYLQLWCDGHGAASGELDAVLAESRRLRRSTYRLLTSICDTLTHQLSPTLMPGLDSISRLTVRDKADRAKELVDIAASDVHVADHSESDSDSESDESSSFGDYTYETMIEDLKTDIQCLVDLGPRYKEPIRDKVVEEESSMSAQVKTWDPAEYLTSRIRHRYPNGDVALTQVLGQVNWERARRLYALKETNAGAGQRPAPGTKPPGTVVASDFYDSGLGTSVATPSSYAETVFSYHGTQGGSIKIPPVPTEGLDGNPFPCDICGRMCRLPGASWKSLWKGHVLSDLQPYVCVVANCIFSTVPFLGKKAWVRHLELEHDFADPAKDFTCPLCQERVGNGKTSHLARHLEEISLTILPANADSDDKSEETSGEESDEESSDANATKAASELTAKPAVAKNDAGVAEKPVQLDYEEEVYEPGVWSGIGWDPGEVVLTERVTVKRLKRRVSCRNQVTPLPPLTRRASRMGIPTSTDGNAASLSRAPIALGDLPSDVSGPSRVPSPGAGIHFLSGLPATDRGMFRGLGVSGGNPSHTSGASHAETSNERYGPYGMLPPLRLCPELGCEDVFSSEDALRQHIGIAHGEDIRLNSDGSRPYYGCLEPGCGRRWHTWDDLKQHCLEEHAEDAPGSPVHHEHGADRSWEDEPLESFLTEAKTTGHASIQITGASEGGTGQKQPGKRAVSVQDTPVDRTIREKAEAREGTSSQIVQGENNVVPGQDGSAIPDFGQGDYGDPEFVDPRIYWEAGDDEKATENA